MTMLTAKGVVRPASGRQQVDDLDFRPQALVVWWSQQAAPGLAYGNSGGLGFATPDGQAAVAWASDDGATPTRTRRWTSDDAVLGFSAAVASHPALRGAIAFDDHGFAVEWHGDPEAPWVVHYLALGGDDLSHAAVTRFQIGSGGPHPVPGLGFQPDCILLAPACIDEPQTSAVGVLASIGAATAQAQASAGYASGDGAPQSEVRGSQRADAVATIPVPNSGELGACATLRSLDPDGFTLDWELAHLARADMVGLALKGGRYVVGVETSPNSSRRKRLVRVGFRPAAVLAFSWGLGPAAETKNIGRLCIGAATVDAAGCTSWGDRNRGAAPSSTQVRTSEEALLEIADTRSTGLHGRAKLVRFARDGFKLDWTGSDLLRRQFAYVAFGSSDRALLRTSRL